MWWEARREEGTHQEELLKGLGVGRYAQHGRLLLLLLLLLLLPRERGAHILQQLLPAAVLQCRVRARASGRREGGGRAEEPSAGASAIGGWDEWAEEQAQRMCSHTAAVVTGAAVLGKGRARGGMQCIHSFIIHSSSIHSFQLCRARAEREGDAMHPLLQSLLQHAASIQPTLTPCSHPNHAPTHPNCCCAGLDRSVRGKPRAL